VESYKQIVAQFSLASPNPVRRLVGYYFVLGLATAALIYFFPDAGKLFSGEKLDVLTRTSLVLEDGLRSAGATLGSNVATRLEYAAMTLLVFVSSIVLMLPVTWVYMSTREGGARNQAVVQTLLMLPLVVAGIVLIVRDSLALAFSLAGVVAAVRFRASLSDARDVVYIFLAIAVGFAAGVHVLTVALLLSVIFNFVLLFIWRHEFGQNILEPTVAEHWTRPLDQLAGDGTHGKGVPDRDLVLALTPLKADALIERFAHVKSLLGNKSKRPKFDAILTITSDHIADAQQHVERVMDISTKRWKLDEVITNTGKPSELFYLLKVRKTVPRDALLTAIRTAGGAAIDGAALEVGDAIVIESGEKRALRKLEEKPA